MAYSHTVLNGMKFELNRICSQSDIDELPTICVESNTYATARIYKPNAVRQKIFFIESP